MNVCGGALVCVLIFMCIYVVVHRCRCVCGACVCGACVGVVRVCVVRVCAVRVCVVRVCGAYVCVRMCICVYKLGVSIIDWV